MCLACHVVGSKNSVVPAPPLRLRCPDLACLVSGSAVLFVCADTCVCGAWYVLFWDVVMQALAVGFSTRTRSGIEL